MISCIKFTPTYISCRGFANYSNFREARFLQKIVNRSMKRNDGNKTSGRLAQEIFTNEKNTCTKRMSNLNKVYMEYIAEIMGTGKNSQKLAGLGVELTKVRVNKELSQMNVFWILTNDKSTDEVIANVLCSTAGELQHELSSLRLIGKSPKIKFVRDLSYDKAKEVERLLQIADCGTDCETDGDLKIHGEITSEMRHNVFGLDHAEITRRILADKGKRNFLLFPAKDVTDSQGIDPGNLITFDKKTYKKFYNRKRILEKKMNKAQNLSDFSVENFNEKYESVDDQEEEEDDEEWDSDSQLEDDETFGDEYEKKTGD